MFCLLLVGWLMLFMVEMIVHLLLDMLVDVREVLLVCEKAYL